MKQRFCLVFLCIFTLGLAQNEQTAAIDKVFEAWDKPDTPGASLGVFKDGEIMYARGYGLANMEYDIPNDANSVFRIGSTSKQFTAACVVLLALDGKLSLDDKLSKFFPGFPDYANSITVKQLLNHTSGVRDYLQLAYLKGLRNDDFYVDEDIMVWLKQQKGLNFEPGSEYLYSNSGYWLLGQIVAEVSGKNMADFAKERIFDPLGMTSTHFHNDHNRVVKNRASGYAPLGLGQYAISMTTLDMIGDGGIFTSINDIKKWDDAYYNNTVFPADFWPMMTTNGILSNGEQIDYAAGLIVEEYKGQKVIRHGGAFVGFRAELLRFPDQKLSIAIFANRADADPSGMADQVADILLESVLKEDEKEGESAASIPDADEQFALESMVGTYRIEAGVELEVAVVNDSLQMTQSWNGSQYAVARVKGNSFQIPGMTTITFAFSELKNNAIQTLTVYQPGETTTCERVNPVDLSSIDLDAYVGSFYSDELDVTYSIAKEGDALQLLFGTRAPADIEISNADLLSANGTILNVQRTGNEVSGFVIESGRVKNIEFTKQK